MHYFCDAVYDAYFDGCPLLCSDGVSCEGEPYCDYCHADYPPDDRDDYF